VSKTQYAEYGDRGFWTYNVALGIFLKHLIDADEASHPMLLATVWI
jgi:hypothetical protein